MRIFAKTKKHFLENYRLGFLLNLRIGSAAKPNIIVVLADDMGVNDAGFHGSNQIPTPNIDALAYNGIILNRSYTQNCCTPSRAALLTGNYPIRSAMQGEPMKAGENRSLPANMPTLAEKLKGLGYKTHLVGKWHLGSAYRNVTPTERGFDTHFGYWNGFIGYFNFECIQSLPNGQILSGFDLHDRFNTSWGYKGRYFTDLVTERAEDIIDKHDSQTPLFLFVSHLAPHGGKYGVELEVPDIETTNKKYSYIKNPQRRRYADMVNQVDISLGKIVQKLDDKGLLENSIILFSSDNGAPTVGMFANTGSNWPFRGIKMTNFEGGVRAVTAIFSPLFKFQGYVSNELIHISDWFPTFYRAAGGKLTDLGTIDGIDQWEVLSQREPTKRNEILLNIDELEETSGIIGNSGVYKYLNGSYKGGIYDFYFGESGRSPKEPIYNTSSILESNTNLAVKKYVSTPLTQAKIITLRAQSDLSWCRKGSFKTIVNCAKGCLFNLKKDPCEKHNIIKHKSEIAQQLSERIKKFYDVLVPQKNPVVDPKANPDYYNKTWCTWLDNELCVKTPKLF